MTEKTVALWLVKYTPQGPVVLLQQRAETEKIDGKIVPQSNPFYCQPAMNGKVERGETIAFAIVRELTEELGPNFVSHYVPDKPEESEPFYTQQFPYKGHTMTGYNFFMRVNEKQLRLIRLHSGAKPLLIGVTREDLKAGKIKKKGDEGADPREHIVLFPDQYEALIELFQII